MDEKLWAEIDEKEPIPEHIRERMEQLRARRRTVPEDRLIKRPTMIEGIRKAGIVNTGVLDEVAKHIKAGMTTQQIDDIVVEYTHAHGGICAPYGFEGYPKSVCTSINEEVCHGIPSKLRKIHDGDIINVDATTIVDGYYADASGITSDMRKVIIEVKTREMVMTPDGQMADANDQSRTYGSVMIEGHKMTDLILDSISGYLPLYINFLADGSVIIFNMSNLKTRPITSKTRIYSKAAAKFDISARYLLDMSDAIITKINTQDVR